MGGWMGLIEYSGIATLILVWIISRLIYRWKSRKSSHGRLPPGSLGWPVLGETISFFRPYSSSDIHPFVKERMERYGPIFKTSFVGQPFIVSADPELNHFIFQHEGRLFQSWYPTTFTEVFGRQNMSSIHGFMYKYLKSLILSHFGAESLKHTLLPQIDRSVTTALASWASRSSVEIREASAAMIFELTGKVLLSYDPAKAEDMRQNFKDFIDGLISFPVYIPGTAFYKCIQGRRNVVRKLKEMLEERRGSPRDHRRRDFFDHLMDELRKDGSVLTENVALDLMFVLLFASFETTASALTMAIKFLTEHPKVVEKLAEEHDEILRKKDNPEDEFISWEEYKSMTFTSQVLNETVRLSNIAPGIFRKTLKEFNIKGYTIPKGWAIMVCPPAVHLHPDVYEDPLSFNPWRWEGLDTSGGSKNFMAFGGGMRFCVGADFSRLQMTLFLHHLVTKYRWSLIKGGDIVRNPGLTFPNGIHIRLFPKNK